MTNILTILRHAEKLPGSENLSDEGLNLARSRSHQLRKKGRKYALVKVSDLSRTLHTAHTLEEALEIGNLKLDPRLSKSVKEYKTIPWKGTFSEVMNSYEKNPPTRELGEIHASIYLDTLRELKEGEGALFITHETRAEAALCDILKNLKNMRWVFDMLGAHLGYTEGYTLSIGQNQLPEKIATHRNNISDEVIITLQSYGEN